MSVRWNRSEPGVYKAVIDRPEVRNAIDFETMDGLEEVVGEVEADDAARVMTLRGAGDAFVSGGDLELFSALETREEVAQMSQRMKALLARIENLDCWTVACINGAAFGGGCEMALAFDVRISSERARFGFVQAKLGIPPGWGGLTRLVRLVGRSQALFWLGSAAVIGADEARDAGLVDEVSPPRGFAEHVDKIITRLAGTSPQLIKTLKEGAERADTLPRDEALEAELEPFCQMWGSEEHRRRVQSFLDN